MIKTTYHFNKNNLSQELKIRFDSFIELFTKEYKN